MADRTNIHELEQAVKIAKNALATARKDKADSKVIEKLKKHVNIAETKLKAAKKALGS